MKWFNNPQCVEDLKAQYKRLAMDHHPDRGGRTADMQEINNEYDSLFQRLKDIHRAASGATYTAKEATSEKAEDFREIFNRLINLAGLHIEICGSWVWVSGDTKKYKDVLKHLSFRWSQSKTAWYYHSTPYRKRNSRNYSLDEIRDLYGSETVRSGSPLAMQIV
ncbi:MAG: hypothetical protein Q3982_02420 [Phoenicibacter congonensis]|uniref:Molecular chaperone DnaJ n=1 Tax=Phoenicibacter congonensis TaxID=1944646 RepID=A0AA43U8T9_9ACTN|nr:hypothetical protein [Phoenicibacter congonensis]